MKTIAYKNQCLTVSKGYRGKDNAFEHSAVLSDFIPLNCDIKSKELL